MSSLSKKSITAICDIIEYIVADVPYSDMNKSRYRRLGSSLNHIPKSCFMKYSSIRKKLFHGKRVDYMGKYTKFSESGILSVASLSGVDVWSGTGAIVAFEIDVPPDYMILDPRKVLRIYTDLSTKGLIPNGRSFLIHGIKERLRTEDEYILCAKTGTPKSAKAFFKKTKKEYTERFLVV